MSGKDAGQLKITTTEKERERKRERCKRERENTKEGDLRNKGMYHFAKDGVNEGKQAQNPIGMACPRMRHSCIMHSGSNNLRAEAGGGGLEYVKFNTTYSR